MQTFPVLIDLPKDYLIAIGRIVVTWSLIERQLANIVYMLLRVDKKRGRLAIRSPRAFEYITMIEQLSELDTIAVNRQDLSALKALLEKVQKYRDLAIHGAWLRGADDHVYVQDISGNWRPGKAKTKVPRRVKPEAVEVSAEDLAGFADKMRTAALLIDRVHQETEAQLRASPRKPLER